jgi:hypothetical protein
MKNMEKKNWLITYLDIYDEPVHLVELEDMTADEAILAAENKMPDDRFINDYHVEPLTKE